MKGLKFTILSHGYIENDMAWNVAMACPATKSNRNPKPQWIQAPSYSVLIFHPEAGYILYDSGPCPGDEKNRRPSSMADIFPLYIKREEFLDGQLQKVDLSVEDISLVVLSHMHWDHSGGMEFFKNKSRVQKVIAPREDFSFGLTETAAPYRVSEECAYFRKNYEFDNLDYKLISRDQNLYEGIDMILLPGHTPAVLGLVLHLESKTYIFPSDAINNHLNYGPNAKPPGIIYDTLGFKDTVQKVMEIEKRYNAQIIFPHDMEQFEGLLKAPCWYE